jgi:hypothetical protein
MASAIFWDMTFCQNFCKKIYSLFYFASSEIIGVEFCDRQSHKFLDTIYRRVCVFFSSQNFLPPYWLCSQGIKLGDFFAVVNLRHILIFAQFDRGDRGWLDGFSFLIVGHNTFNTFNTSNRTRGIKDISQLMIQMLYNLFLLKNMESRTFMKLIIWLFVFCIFVNVITQGCILKSGIFLLAQFCYEV